jgi:hypothetical protein
MASTWCCGRMGARGWATSTRQNYAHTGRIRLTVEQRCSSNQHLYVWAASSAAMLLLSVLQVRHVLVQCISVKRQADRDRRGEQLPQGRDSERAPQHCTLACGHDRVHSVMEHSTSQHYTSRSVQLNPASILLCKYYYNIDSTLCRRCDRRIGRFTEKRSAAATLHIAQRSG